MRLQIMAARGQRVCTIVGKPLHLQNICATQYDDELEPTAAVGPRGDKSTWCEAIVVLTNMSVVMVATTIDTLDCSLCGSARASVCSFAMSSVPSFCTSDRLFIVKHGRGEVGMSQAVGGRCW